MTLVLSMRTYGWARQHIYLYIYEFAACLLIRPKVCRYSKNSLVCVSLYSSNFQRIERPLCQSIWNKQKKKKEKNKEATDKIKHIPRS